MDKKVTCGPFRFGVSAAEPIGGGGGGGVGGGGDGDDSKLTR